MPPQRQGAHSARPSLLAPEDDVDGWARPHRRVYRLEFEEGVVVVARAGEQRSTAAAAAPRGLPVGVSAPREEGQQRRERCSNALLPSPPSSGPQTGKTKHSRGYRGPFGRPRLADRHRRQRYFPRSHPPSFVRRMPACPSCTHPSDEDLSPRTAGRALVSTWRAQATDRIWCALHWSAADRAQRVLLRDDRDGAVRARAVVSARQQHRVLRGVHA